MSKYLDIAAVSLRSVAIAFENPLGFQIPRLRWDRFTNLRRYVAAQAISNTRVETRSTLRTCRWRVCASLSRARLWCSNLLLGIFKSTEISKKNHLSNAHTTSSYEIKYE